MFVRLAVTFGFLALIGVLVGCGGGGSSSVETSSGYPGGQSTEYPKEAFIEEADDICADYKAKRRPITDEIEAIEGSTNPESPKNVVRLGRLLKEAIALADGELESIRELETPQGDGATIGKMLDAAQEDNDRGAEAAEALEEGETSRFNALLKEAEAVSNRATGIAEGYGLKVCGQES